MADAVGLPKEAEAICRRLAPFVGMFESDVQEYVGLMLNPYQAFVDVEAVMVDGIVDHLLVTWRTAPAIIAKVWRLNEKKVVLDLIHHG